MQTYPGQSNLSHYLPDGKSGGAGQGKRAFIRWGDYILKPFSLKELDARIIAHLKREERHKGKSEYRFHGDLSIDYGAKRVQIGENDLELTKLEYAIIEFLSMNPGQVFDRERIYEKVCGYDAEGDSRVVTELIRRVRKKLAEYTQTEYIETVWGMGYRWKR